MSMGSIGIGSGVLTSDILDKLRVNDEKVFLGRINNDIQTNEYKQKAITELSDVLKKLTDSIQVLKSPEAFINKTVTSSNDAFEVNITEGANTQNINEMDFSFKVTEIAKKEIKESDTFTSKGELGKDGTLTINGTDIDYSSADTLTDLANKINESGTAQATILRVGEDDYRLMISGNETGAGNTVDISDAGNLLGAVKTLQAAQDAKAELNGQEINSSTNTFEPIEGITIKALKEGESNISIKKDTDALYEKIDAFKDAYNESVQKLQDLTKSSMSKSGRGIFSGDSQISGIERMVSNMRMAFNEFGFDIDKEGKLSYDKENMKIDDTEKILEMFSDQFKTLDIITGYNGRLDMAEDSLESRNKELQKNLASQTERLNSKYDIMKTQFIAFDKMIAQMNNASANLAQMMGIEPSK